MKALLDLTFRPAECGSSATTQQSYAQEETTETVARTRRSY